MTEDERAIRELVDNWFVSSRRGDLATVLDLIADDAIFMVAGKPPFDKAAFAAASREANAGAEHAPKVDGRYRIDELRVIGDWAYMRNFLEIDATPPGGETIRRSGHTLTIFRKADGRWQLVRDANLVTLAH
ncbi:SgcJ/EcaC family oxidoreductase [Burkholderia pyrrocinia]|uniref:YybH family protein n=1 Tax=Burkholderia pyrrocinia TaxID=60550 RepID=UPI001576DCCA|nr:SgcJ/EcaC family oxidoreductase [Burkholderia pyrrocinia]NTX27586.1 SgcJ/EcaC family oxidoreductase [Burkholderia pyrrocinia]